MFKIMNEGKKNVIINNYKDRFNSLVKPTKSLIKESKQPGQFHSEVPSSQIEVKGGKNEPTDVNVGWSIYFKNSSTTIGGFDIVIDSLVGWLKTYESQISLDGFTKEAIITNSIDNKSDFGPIKMIVDVNKKIVSIIF